MKTIEIAGRKYNVKRELANGDFYLERSNSGYGHFAKPLIDDLFTVSPISGGPALRDDNGLLITVTREELTA